GCNANYYFALKCLMKEKPLTLQIGAMICSIFGVGFCFRVFERPLGDASHQYFTYENSFWNVVTTMTTVGYGDFFPKTNVGWLFGVLLCFWCTWIVSLLVVSIQVTLKLTPAEEKTY